MGTPHPKPSELEGCKHGGDKKTCARCRGSRNRRGGQRKQRQAMKQAGVKVPRHGLGGNEENWKQGGLASHFAIEAKSGKQVPKKVQDCFDQIERARALGDTRPPMVLWAPANTSTTYAMVATEDLRQILEAAGPEGSRNVRDIVRKARKLLGEAEEAL